MNQCRHNHTPIDYNEDTVLSAYSQPSLHSPAPVNNIGKMAGVWRA